MRGATLADLQQEEAGRGAVQVGKNNENQPPLSRLSCQSASERKEMLMKR